jgi:hypothetical protein
VISRMSGPKWPTFSYNCTPTEHVSTRYIPSRSIPVLGIREVLKNHREAIPLESFHLHPTYGLCGQSLSRV